MKRSNEYASYVSSIFDKTPKAVFAAIAVSFAIMQAEDDTTAALNGVQREWWTLYDNRIVPQKPPFPRPSEEKQP